MNKFSRRIILCVAIANILTTGCNDQNAFPLASPTHLSVFAGDIHATGHTDGTGPAARFYHPTGLSTDTVGNIYVVDTGNSIIRKITPAGIVTTLAGTAGMSGNADGSGPAASFGTAYGATTDSMNNVYIADTSNNTIRKITPTGVVTTFAGTPGIYGHADGLGAAASFNSPYGVAADLADNIYVADSDNNTIRKITPAGFVTTFAGTPGTTGSADGNGAAAEFNYPFSLATDNAGNIYVSDTFNRTIRKITPAGVVSTFAGAAGVQGSTDGTGTAARFSAPYGIAVDSAGNVYVTDAGSYTIRKITPAGVVTTPAGTPGTSGFIAGTLPGTIDDSQGVAISGAKIYFSNLDGIGVLTQ